MAGAGGASPPAPLRMSCLAAVLAAFAATASMSPAAADEKALAGQAVYNTHCVLCHGAAMVNTGSRAFDLRKFPLSQRGRFYKAVKQGKDKMPAWQDILSEEEIGNLWAYVKTRGKL